MKEWMEDLNKKYGGLFQDYGKVFFVSICLIIIFVSVVSIFNFVSTQKLRVSFLDVGQGDAILIQTPSGKNILVDGGPSAVIRTRLSHEMSYFDNDIDVMVATHPDADHVTGLIPVLEKYNVKKIIISKAESQTGVFDTLNKSIEKEKSEVYITEAGDSIDFHDGVILKVLYPPKNYVEKKNDTNDASISLIINYGDQSFLLTGDLPSTKESKLISSGYLNFNKKITVYKAGHHGSKTSSGEQLLSFIHPEYVVISAGKDNKYGHPNIETIDRLEIYAKEIISTVDRGTISFITDGRLMEVETTK